VRVSSGEHSKDHRDKKKRRWNKQLVAVVLQGFAKIIAAKKLVRDKRKLLNAAKKLTKKKRVSTFTFKKAATIIQSFFRSSCARIKLLKMITAGLVINKAYRQHRAYKRLRGDLRRVEKPCRIKLHGIRNLPEQIFTKGGTGGIGVRVSCYWSGLLHIFNSPNELKGVIRGKKPQWTFMTEFHSVNKQFTEKELLAEMHEVEARKVAEDQSKGLLSRLSRVGTSFIGGGKNSIGQRKSVVDFQHRNLQRLKSIQALKRLDEEDESESSESSDEEEEQEEEESDSGSVPFKPSKYQSLQKKENRTLDRQETDIDMGKQKYCSAFQDEFVRVPCIHGNSALKFEYMFADGTQFAESIYFCSESKGLMFWGGEMGLHLNYKSNTPKAPSPSTHHRETRRNEIISPEFDLMATPPSLEFTLSCGTPMMSRCGYSKVKLTSNGPMMNAMYSAFGFFHFFLNTWKKYYLSLDGVGLSFFDTKHSSSPFHIIPVSEITFVAILQGKPTSVASAPFEDTHDVIIKTIHHETIFLRLSDTGSRVFWHEVLVSCIKGVPSYTVGRQDSKSSEDNGSQDDGGKGFLSNMSVLGAVGGAANATESLVRGSASLVGGGVKNIVGTILPGAFIPGFLRKQQEGDESSSAAAGIKKTTRSRHSFVADQIFDKINKDDGKEYDLSRVNSGRSEVSSDSSGRGGDAGKLLGAPSNNEESDEERGSNSFPGRGY
jgi:hypothetical protein